MDPAPPPSDAPTAAPSWRRRHPVLARAALYGGALALLAGGVVVGRAVLEDARQDGLATRLNGIALYVSLDPDRAVSDLEGEVLAKSPEPDTERRALLLLAAAHDTARRYDEAERAYRRADAAWPASGSRGPLVVPWANMRISAGRPREALDLLDGPGAVAGWSSTSTSADDVRRRAQEALDAVPPAAGARAPR